jgi:serine/threonine protein kinase
MSLITCSNGHKNPEGSRFCFACGEPLSVPNIYTVGVETELPPGTRLRDRYVIRHQLGQGGFGRTYLAEDTGRFNELVVLKELTPSDQGTYALQKAEELFQREAGMMHKLQHPQIPRFGEIFRDGKRLFLVQEYIEGKTYQSLLDDRLAINQRFSEAEIIQLLRQLLPVLSYLHRQGVIHRDISPDNIIRRAKDGIPVLIDLGGVKQIAIDVATQVAQSQSAGTRLGKIGYAPEEQMRMGIVAPHSDLYALGVTSVVLMTGKQPQELIDPQTLNWIWNRQLSLSPQFNKIIQRMLANRSSERFQSAEEILQQLPHDSGVPETQVQNISTGVQLQGNNYGPTSIPVNTSGQGNIFDNSIPVPDEIQGWNWGAFLLPGLWCLTNHVWIGLLSWLDLSVITFGMTSAVMGVILGAKGNEWAWKSRRWSSVAAFKAHQRAWAIAAFIIWGVILLLVLLLIVAVVLGIATMGMGMSD